MQLLLSAADNPAETPFLRKLLTELDRMAAVQILRRLVKVLEEERDASLR